MFDLGCFLVPSTGMVKNTSVRARSDSDDAFRGFPFKGIGNSRENAVVDAIKKDENPSVLIKGRSGVNFQ